MSWKHATILAVTCAVVFFSTVFLSLTIGDAVAGWWSSMSGSGF